jgi:uracil-DNA glycosylase family 4
VTKTEELRSELAKRNLRYIGIRGDVNAPICLVGEAGGEEEERQGLPFVGGSGKELDRMILEAGIDITKCYFTNPYKVRPPQNQLDRLSELGVPLELFHEQFFEELNQYKPTFIVALGATALGLLCEHTKSHRAPHAAEITKFQGSLLTSDKLPWKHYVIPCLHPAFILRSWSDRVVAVLCLGKVAEEYAYWRTHNCLQPLPERKLIADPSAQDAIDFLRGILAAAPSQLTAADIENIGVFKGKYRTPQRNRLPYVLGLATSAKLGMSIGLGEYEKGKTEEIWRLIDTILRTRRLIGQNYYTHDAPWLEYLGFGSNIGMLDDTLVRHHVLWPELSHKLQFQTMQYTREPYYKDEGHNWTVKDRLRLKRYNIKDCCVDFEIYERQEEEFDANPGLKKFYSDYEMPLARAFYNINKRGITIDASKLASLRQYIEQELKGACSRISSSLGGRGVVSSAPVDQRGKKQKLLADTVNLSSPQQIIETLKSIGIKPPMKNRGKGQQRSETSDEEALNELYAETGHVVLKEILRVRELNKVLGTNVNAELEQGVLYSAYFVTGTVTGRRSSRENFLGLGSNGQNTPKHSDLGKRYNECLVSRPGKIFVACDQVSAEDWVIQGLIADVSGNKEGLKDLVQGGRHEKLACFIFSKPPEQIRYDVERYIAKKVRYAGSYDMGPNRFASVMASEGYVFPEAQCEWLLDQFHKAEPTIRGVFQDYVKSQLIANRTLVTPLGRVRQFFALRDYSDNKKVFKEGFAQIPQSTVGDNTGLAILWLEQNHPGIVVRDGHDSVVTEVKDSLESVLRTVRWLQAAFDRTITFPNGLQIKIPIEVELGHDLEHMKKIKNHNNQQEIEEIYNELSGLMFKCDLSESRGSTNISV